MKKNMHIYPYLNHFAIYEKLTQHCKSTIDQLKTKQNKNFPAELDGSEMAGYSLFCWQV